MREGIIKIYLLLAYEKKIWIAITICLILH